MSSAGGDGGVSLAVFKAAMAHLAGGVVIVTTADPAGARHGMTATAVCSVSLEPPLVMACMSRDAATHRAVSVSGAFALNLLSDEAESLARRFASSRLDKFEGLATTPAASGAPLLDGALAHCDCTVEQTVTAGDHTIFIGRVSAADVSAIEDATPLLYYRGDYRTVAEPA